MEKAVFFTGYHVGVNDCLVSDFNAIGYKVYLPTDNYGIVHFFGDNSFGHNHPNVEFVNYWQFLKLPPMFLLAACVQQAHDFKHLWELRGKKDKYIWHTATQDAVDFPADFTDYLMSQDIHFHRKSTAKYKMIYFNRPSIHYFEKDFKKSFESKQINFFCNELTTHPRHAMILEDLRLFREAFPQTKFYGFQAEHGNLHRPDMHKLITESLFTIGIKHWETWGQTINESMLLGTPTIHLNKFSINLFNDYLITQDTAVIGNTIEEIIQKINSMSYENYMNLCIQARTMSEMFTADEPRRKQLDWFLSND